MPSPRHRRRSTTTPIPRSPRTILPPEYQPFKTAYQLLILTNTLRSRFNQPPLRLSKTLCLVASDHSQYQASISRMTHRGRGGTHHSDRMRNMGYHRYYSGENVAAGQLNVEQVFSGWVRSKSHRQNLIRAFRDMGAWVVVGKQKVRWLYWTQVFGIRK